MANFTIGAATGSAYTQLAACPPDFDMHTGEVYLTTVGEKLLLTLAQPVATSQSHAARVGHIAR
jgi:hypothetical protein